MDRSTFAALHLALAALALHLAADKFPTQANPAADLPDPLPAFSEPMTLPLPVAPAAAPRAASKASVRVAALKVDARALAATTLSRVAAPALAGQDLGAASANLDKADAVEPLSPREAPRAEAVSEHLENVFSPGRAGGNAEYGVDSGLVRTMKASPMLALAGEPR